MTDWMTGVCNANGIDIHYIRTGGSKPPLGFAPWIDWQRGLLEPLSACAPDEYGIVMPDASAKCMRAMPSSRYKMLAMGLCMTSRSVLKRRSDRSFDRRSFKLRTKPPIRSRRHP